MCLPYKTYMCLSLDEQKLELTSYRNDIFLFCFYSIRLMVHFLDFGSSDCVLVLLMCFETQVFLDFMLQEKY